MLNYLKYAYHKRNFKHMMADNPAQFLNLLDTAKVVNTPIKVYAYCESVIGPDTSPEGVPKSPIEVNDSLEANIFDKVIFMASLLHINKFRVNIISIGKDIRSAEEYPLHLFVMARSGKNYITLGQTYGVHDDNLISVIEDYIKSTDIDKPVVLVYDHTGEEMVATFIGGSEVPLRIKEGYDPRRDIA